MPCELLYTVVAFSLHLVKPVYLVRSNPEVSSGDRVVPAIAAKLEKITNSVSLFLPVKKR